MKNKIILLTISAFSVFLFGCSSDKINIEDIYEISENLNKESKKNTSLYYLIENAVTTNKISNPVREFYWLTDGLFGVDVNYELASKALLKVKKYDRETFDWMVISLEDGCLNYGCDFMESVKSLKEKYPNNAYLSAFIKSDGGNFTYENGTNIIYKNFNLSENSFETNLFRNLIGVQETISDNAFFALSADYRYIGSFNKNYNICHKNSKNFDKDYCLKLYQEILINDNNFVAHQYSRMFLSMYCNEGWCNDSQKKLLEFSSPSYFNRMQPKNYILEFKRMNYVLNKAIDTGEFCDDIDNKSNCYKDMEELNGYEKFLTAVNILFQK